MRVIPLTPTKNPILMFSTAWIFQRRNMLITATLLLNITLSQTNLWNNHLESDFILQGLETPHYSIPVTHCDFKDNLSPYGAGLCLDASNVNITESQFSSNTAHVGAGGLLFACDATAQNNLFAHNTAEEVPTQGNQSQLDAGTVQIIGSGAGLYLAACDSFLTNNHFAGNTTNGYGGGLYIDGLSPTGWPQSVFNNLFVENEAESAGGALIAENGTDVEVLNCTFVDNLVTDYYGYGGGIVAHDAYMSINNTILWDNSADMGPQICVGDPLELFEGYDPEYVPYTTVYLDYSDVKGGENDVYVDDSGFPWLDYGDNNIEDDPLFVETGEPLNTVDRMFYLKEVAAGQDTDSPCLNAGIPLSSAFFVYDPAEGGFITIPGAEASSTLEWLAGKLGFDITTRTDHVVDDEPVNMGYHYNAQKPNKSYTLTLKVDRGDETTQLTASFVGESGFTITADTPLEERKIEVPAGVVVALQAAFTDSAYLFKQWHGTDNDTLETLSNTITMTGDKLVSVECDTTSPMLRIFVVDEDGNPADAEGVVTPLSGEPFANGWLYAENDTVTLQATPTNPSDSVRWQYTDDDALLGWTNSVTMTESIDVYVTFYTPTIYDVTGDFTELQHAIYDASDGDIIILHPGLYDAVQPILRVGKNITIQSYNPDDPDTVADTILESRFYVSDTDRRFILNGITIQNQHWYGVDGCPGKDTSCGNEMDDGSNGVSTAGAGIRFYGDASATIKNCIIRNCSITGGNGGKGAQDGDGGWGGWGRGGAVYVGVAGDPRFINCQFSDNYARGGGGGDAGDGGASGRGGSWDEELNQWPDWDWEPIGGYLPYWKYSGYGGAVYCDEDSTPEFSNCVFSNNIAYGGHTGLGGWWFATLWLV